MKTPRKSSEILFLAVFTATACADQKLTAAEIIGNRSAREAVMTKNSNDNGMMAETRWQMAQK